MTMNNEQSGDLGEGLNSESQPLGVASLLDLSTISSEALDGFDRFSEKEREAVTSVLEAMSHVCAVRGSFYDSFGLLKLKEAFGQNDAAKVAVLDPYLWPKKIRSNQALEVCRGILTRVSNTDIGKSLAEQNMFKDFGGMKVLFDKALSGNTQSIEFISDGLVELYKKHGASRDCLSFSRSLKYVQACLGSKPAMNDLADILFGIREKATAKHYFDDATLQTIENGWRYVAWSDPRHELDTKAEETYLGYVECDFLTDSLPEVFSSQVFSKYHSDHRVIDSSSKSEGETDKADTKESDGEKSDSSEREEGVSGVLADQPSVKVLRGVDADVGLSNPKYQGGRYNKLTEPLRVVQASDPDQVYGELMKEFPWMPEANEIVGLACATSSRDDLRTMRVPPVLLVGPSGAGKSRWSRRVAEILGLYHHRSNMAGSQSSLEIIGSENGWTNARPSLPIIVFGASGIANPMLLLDEIDKTQSGSNGDPVDGLLPMLEEETASSYSDRCLLASFDISRISFVFTANSESGLGTPFLDRVKLVQARKPTPDQFEAALPGILAGAARKLKIDDWDSDPELASKVMGVYRNGGSIRSAISAAESELTALIWRPKGKGGHLRLV